MRTVTRAGRRFTRTQRRQPKTPFPSRERKIKVGGTKKKKSLEEATMCRCFWRLTFRVRSFAKRDYARSNGSETAGDWVRNETTTNRGNNQKRRRSGETSPTSARLMRQRRSGPASMQDSCLGLISVTRLGQTRGDFPGLKLDARKIWSSDPYCARR